MALLVKGDLGAPSCIGCHGSHAAQPPEVASVAQVCRRCHAQNGILFDGSRHKKVFEEHKWPECGQCHGHHDIEKPTVARIGDTDDTLCGKCHNVYSRKNPKCNETAVHFRTALDAMIAGRAQVAGEEEHLAEAGLDVEPLARSLSDLDEALVQSKSKVRLVRHRHLQSVGAAGERGPAEVAAADRRGQERVGIPPSRPAGGIGFMVLLVAGIGLKLRQLENKRRERRRSSRAGSLLGGGRAGEPGSEG